MSSNLEEQWARHERAGEARASMETLKIIAHRAPLGYWKCIPLTQAVRSLGLWRRWVHTWMTVQWSSEKGFLEWWLILIFFDTFPCWQGELSADVTQKRGKKISRRIKFNAIASINLLNLPQRVKSIKRDGKGNETWNVIDCERALTMTSNPHKPQQLWKMYKVVGFVLFCDEFENFF